MKHKLILILSCLLLLTVFPSSVLAGRNQLDITLEQAIDHRDKGRYREAMILFMLIIKQDANPCAVCSANSYDHKRLYAATAHGELGALQFEMGNIEQATLNCHKAISMLTLQKRSIPGRYYAVRGMGLIHRGDKLSDAKAKANYDAARKDFDTACAYGFTPACPN